MRMGSVRVEKLDILCVMMGFYNAKCGKMYAHLLTYFRKREIETVTTANEYDEIG